MRSYFLTLLPEDRYMRLDHRHQPTRVVAWVTGHPIRAVAESLDQLNRGVTRSVSIPFVNDPSRAVTITSA